MTIESAQRALPHVGPFFDVLYRFCERTMVEYFSDVPEMPKPTITLEIEPNRRAGSYQPFTTALVQDCINLNPHAHSTGADMAQTLAHELVHLWENHTGRPCTNNIHDDVFHDRMLQMFGIRTAGQDGHHMNVDDRWLMWLEENADLELETFLLPGKNRKPPRRMFKHTCPGCGASFHARTEMLVLCGECPWGNEPEPPRFVVTK